MRNLGQSPRRTRGHLAARSLVAGRISFARMYRPANPCRLHSMAGMSTEWWLATLCGFLHVRRSCPEVSGTSKVSGERRIYLMTAQPNRSSTPIWRKSSASAGGGECVEVAQWKSSVLVRDSGDRSGTILELTLTQWRGFVQRVKN